MTHLILFEDAHATRFLPLAWTRPVWELRCGIWTLGEAIERAYRRRADALFARPFLADGLRERTGRPVNASPVDGMALLVNGRLLADDRLREAIPLDGPARRWVAPDGTLLAARAESNALNAGWAALETLPAETVTWPLLEWPWELWQGNAARIAAQAAIFPLGEQPTLVGVHLLRPEAIFVHPTARVQPGVVLDATDGPIVIDEGATVMANAAIQGPGYVGRGSSVKLGAKIYHGTTIGPTCKVGGEVEETIFHGFSNKQHDGFLGHAYVGEWCNFGAGTSNSDLKNNYKPVSLWCQGALRDTGSLFVGLLMGDHSKTAINTSVNTGTVVGVACNLFGAELPPKFVPSFTWGSSGESEYRLDDALDTAARVMQRRGLRLSEAERALLTHVFRETAGERTGR